MNFTYKTLLLTAGVISSSFTFASSASVSLTNETAKGDVNFSMGSFGLSGGIIQDIEADSSTAYVGLAIQDSDTEGPLQVGLGVRFNVIDAELENDDNELSIALGLGGWYRYTLEQANRLSLYGSIYYSPEVLSFSDDLNHTYTYEFRAEYMTMRNARAYVAYGNTVVVYDDGSRAEINKGFSVGADVTF